MTGFETKTEFAYRQNPEPIQHILSNFSLPPTAKPSTNKILLMLSTQPEEFVLGD